MAARERAIEVYEQYVKPLRPEERLKLLALVANDLLVQPDVMTLAADRDILELRGLGKEIWKGIDAQEYVNKLRDEWECRDP